MTVFGDVADAGVQRFSGREIGDVASVQGDRARQDGSHAHQGLDELGLSTVSFLPPLGLLARELPWLASIPAGAAAIAWGTARISVIAALHELY